MISKHAEPLKFSCPVLLLTICALILDAWGIPAHSNHLNELMNQRGRLIGPPKVTFPLAKKPSRQTAVNSKSENNVFTSGEEISFALSEAGANWFQVLDIDGHTICSGQISDKSIDLPPIKRFGWYQLQVLGANVDDIFGNAYGDATFAVVPDAHFRQPGANSAQGTSYPSDPQSVGACPGIHALFDCGPIRFAIPTFKGDRTSKISQARKWAQGIAANVAYDRTCGWASITTDGARPRKHMVSFADFNGAEDELACVQAVAGTTVLYEGRNEPQGTKLIMPATATLTWRQPQKVKRRGVFFARPWHQTTAPVAFTIDALVNGVWKPVYAYSNPTAVSISFASCGTGSTVETFYNGEYVIHVLLKSKVTVTALRLNFSQSTFGDCPDKKSNQMAIHPQGSPQHLTLNDFRAYTN